MCRSSSVVLGGLALFASLGDALGAPLQSTPDESRVPLEIECRTRKGMRPEGAIAHFFFRGSGEKQSSYLERGPFETDIDGRVRCAVPEAANGPFFVHVRQPGKLVGVYSSHVKKKFEAGARHRVILLPAARIEGDLVMPKAHRVRQATVSVMRIEYRGFANNGKRYRGDFRRSSGVSGLENALPDWMQTGVDARGRFALSELPHGAIVYLRAAMPGLGMAQWVNKADGRYFLFPTPPERIRLNMSIEARVRGTVYGPQGRPCPDAIVSAVPLRSDHGPVHMPWALRTRATKDGEFDLKGVSEGVVELRVRSPNPNWVWMPLRTRVDRASKAMAIRMEVGRLVRGVAVDEKGAPLAGVSFRFGRGDLDLGTATTGARGRFAIRLPRGMLTLRSGATQRGYMPRGGFLHRSVDTRADKLAELRIAFRRVF